MNHTKNKLNKTRGNRYTMRHEKGGRSEVILTGYYLLINHYDIRNDLIFSSIFDPEREESFTHIPHMSELTPIQQTEIAGCTDAIIDAFGSPLNMSMENNPKAVIDDGISVLIPY